MVATAPWRLLSVLSIGMVSASSVTPVQKVIQLLQDMRLKAVAEKNAEAVEYAKFQQFCTDTISNKKREIEDDATLMESLSAEIGKLDSDVTTLGNKITDLKAEVVTAEKKIKETDEQREKDVAMYKAASQDYAESVDALGRAINVLSKQDYNRAQAEGASMLQRGGALPESVRRAAMAVLLETGSLDEPSEFLFRENPQAHGYEFQSTNIVDLLKKLKIEFTQKRSESEKEEINSRDAHKMISQDLHDQIEGATSDIADKTVLLEETKQLAAEKKGLLASTTADHDEAVVYLKDLEVECEEKGKSFEEKQDLRAEELKAIDKAIEILSSDSVSGASDTHLPASFIQRSAAKTALVQLRGGDDDPRSETRKALMVFLAGEGKRLHSKSLGLLAEQAASNPFAKVKKMIDDLITKLLEETNSESEQKGWCDKELGMSEKTRTKLQSSIDGLTADIDQTKASLAQMSQRLAELGEELTELQKAKGEAIDLRNAEKTKNEATIKDAAEAQTAVASAVAVLKEFYEGAATATAFIQQPVGVPENKQGVAMGSVEWDSLANPDSEGYDANHREGMQTFGKTYTGSQGMAGGVLAMLEVIASDFASLQAETESAEAEAEAQHKDFVAASDKSIAVDEKATEMLTNDSTEAESKIQSLTRDLKSTQDQMLAAERYYDKLKPTCVDTGLSYEDRAAAREEEIQSLQEALRILSGEDLSNTYG